MKSKKLIVQILPNHNYAFEKGKSSFTTSSTIINHNELHQKEGELFEAKMIDGKYKLLKRVTE
jgi:hypothetical protein